MTDQLRRDLANRLRERLHQWAGDGADLYDMAGEPSRHAFEDIFYTVLRFMVHGASILEIDENQFAGLIVEMMRAERQHRAKERD
jgi:hypothetical protein